MKDRCIESDLGTGADAIGSAKQEEEEEEDWAEVHSAKQHHCGS